jgi:NADH:ubiquinone oxidoreductase subunit 5 (subunit L)/multisubunit Na+/H+ antiporter MnhA subunit
MPATCDGHGAAWPGDAAVLAGLAGVVTAWVFYLKAPSIPAAIDRALAPVRTVLENKYYMDWFNEHVLAAGARCWAAGCGRAVTRP